jgi:hypothetical protein
MSVIEPYIGHMIIAVIAYLFKAAITEKLTMIGKKVDVLVENFAAAAVENRHNSEEIKILRLRQHEMANEQAKIQAIIEKCKNCTKQ